MRVLCFFVPLVALWAQAGLSLRCDSTSAAVEPGDDVTFYVEVENGGACEDTVDIYLYPDAPEGWILNACTSTSCFTSHAWMAVSPGEIETVTVHFFTDEEVPGTGSMDVFFSARVSRWSDSLRFLVTTESGVEEGGRFAEVFLSVSPALVRSSCTVRYSVLAEGVLRITDLGGDVVAERRVAGRGSCVWRPQGLPCGAYIVSLQTAKGSTAQKVFVVR